jgi:hypothetical protein
LPDGRLDALGADAYLSDRTLEASFLVFLLAPHHRSFNKRVIKQPKLYFLDTGLLCALLGIRSAEQLATHYLRGHIFETYIIAEYVKRCHHAGERPQAWFWRDSHGHEIDLLIEVGPDLCPVEIKAAETLQEDQFRGLSWFRQLTGQPAEGCYLVHGGTRQQVRRDGQVLGWRDVGRLPGPGQLLG